MRNWITEILMPMVAAVHQSQDCVLQVTIFENSASANLIPLDVFMEDEEGEDYEED